MSIERTDFESINELDLLELIAGQVPEGIRLDYKAKTYGGKDDDKKELLKDVTALANTHGGHLILGIEEEDANAKSIVSATDGSIDAELQRLEQIIRSSTEPSLVNFRTKAIPLSSGGSAILIRIPQSWTPPHRVTFRNWNRYFRRNSTGVHEASMEELRIMFTQSTTAMEIANQFRDDRLSLLVNENGAASLGDKGNLLIHIIPIAAIQNNDSVDLNRAHRVHTDFRPIGAIGMTPMFNIDGMINTYNLPEESSYAQLFRNGCVELLKTNIFKVHEGNKLIPSGYFENQIMTSFPSVITGLRKLDIPLPYLILTTLHGVKDVQYFVKANPWDRHSPNITRETLRLPAGLIENADTALEIYGSLKPALDALWNSADYISAQTYNSEGMWTGQ